MNLNTICLRIFFALFFLIVGGVFLALYFHKIITPLAVCTLPTTTADARYTAHVFATFTASPDSILYHSDIMYDGHFARILTATHPTPPVNREKEIAQFNINQAQLDMGLRPTRWDDPLPAPVVERVFKVRYVRAFPSLVVRETPTNSLWSYYGDMRLGREMPGLIVAVALLSAVGYGAYRHFRNSRARRYR
jgi:hypothetical protein